MRPGLLVATWSLAAVAAAGVALGSVRLVGEQVAGLPPVLTPERVAALAAAVPQPAEPAARGVAAPADGPALPGAPVPSAPAPAPEAPAGPADVPAAAAAPAPARQPTAQAPAPAPAAAAPRPTARPSPSPARTVTTRGGTLAVACDGARAVLRYATPSAGFSSEVREQHAGVEVRFRGESAESRVEVVCAGGAPTVRVDERD